MKLTGWLIVALVLIIGLYDLSTTFFPMPSISAEIHGWEKNALILIVFILGFLAGHLVTFDGDDHE